METFDLVVLENKFIFLRHVKSRATRRAGRRRTDSGERAGAAESQFFGSIRRLGKTLASPKEFRKALVQAETADFSSYWFQYPPMGVWKTGLNQTDVLNAWAQSARIRRRPGLYVHIPFCKTKCTFCRFFVLEDDDRDAHAEYVEALGREAALYSPLFRSTEFSTLYFGGGTPSLLDAPQLKRVFSLLRKNFRLAPGAQVCFEANPDFLTQEKLALLKSAGVTRLTIGVQTLDDAVTARIERTQNNGAVREVFHQARAAGIPYINIDVMAGLPGQSLRSFQATFSEVLRWRPDTIHVNPFAPTAFTRFSQRGGRRTAADARRCRAMQDDAYRRMKAAGFSDLPYDAMATDPDAGNRQLEESVIYGNSFLGLGAGAISCISGRFRYVNTGNARFYSRATAARTLPILKGVELQPRQNQIGFILNRLWYGKLADADFLAAFGSSVLECFPDEIRRLEEIGAIARARGGARWTRGSDKGAADFEIRRAFFEPDVVRALTRDV